MLDSTLQDIKDRLNIVDIVGGYIQLKKAGVNFKANCPFHHEKTASLIVSPQKQIWHCFGCGEGGDIFGFVMRYENLEFRETLKLLADKAGVQLPQYQPQDPKIQDEKELLLRINAFAARYYHEVLFVPAGKFALEYLKNRGLTDGTLKQWQIGFAPDDFHALEKALAKKNVRPEEMVKAGVSAKNERGQIYDRFRGRVTFPIFNYFNEVVGFSARILQADANAAKYINSPETLIYNKSRTLFGLNFAKEAIRKKDEAVIVEGQMDCVSAHQAGFSNTVAVSGTALTEAGLAQLARLTKNLKFCFDGDAAGKAAARRAGEMALRQGFKLKLIILTAAKDPDELIKKSPGLWEKAVSEAVWFLDYYIELAGKNFPEGGVEQKLYLSREVVPFLAFIDDPLEQEHYIKKITARFAVSEKIIREQISSRRTPAQNNASQTGAKTDANLLQKEILGGLLVSPEFARANAEKIEPNDFLDLQIRAVAGEFLSSGSLNSEILNGTLAKEAAFVVESQMEELENDKDKLQKNLQSSFKLFKLSAIKRRQLELEAAMKAAETAGQKEKVEELSKNFAAVLNLRKEFEQ